MFLLGKCFDTGQHYYVKMVLLFEYKIIYHIMFFFLIRFILRSHINLRQTFVNFPQLVKLPRAVAVLSRTMKKTEIYSYRCSYWDILHSYKSQQSSL